MATDDLFAQLLPCKWRDVEFPITRVIFSLAHDLVEHKYWGVDGGRIESTGLAPIRISAQIPLLNTIVPGKAEKWDPQQYPTGMRKLLAAFARKDMGVFQHPEFGEIACKAEKIDIPLDANVRGGVMADASWVQTNVTGDTASFLDFATPVQDIELAALDLDASHADLSQLVPELPPLPEKSFTQFARSLQAIGDQVTLLSKRASGNVDRLVYRVQQLEDSVDRARSAMTWPVTQNCERVKEAAHGLTRALFEASRDIDVYIVRADTTLAGLVSQIDNATVGDLVKLNPGLVGNAVVVAGTEVRHYISSFSAAA